MRDNRPKAIDTLVTVFLSACIGSMATYLAISFISKPGKEYDYRILIFYLFKNQTVMYQFFIVLFILVVANIFSSILIGLLSYLNLRYKRPIKFLPHLFLVNLDGFKWSIINFFIPGIMVNLIYSFSYNTPSINLQIFFSAGLIGGAIGTPICCFGGYYIGDVLFKDAAIENLYRLKKQSFFRFLMIFFFYAISAGILFCYCARIVKEGNIFSLILIHRYQIAIIITIWLITLYLYYFMLGENSFLKRALRYQNFCIIWTSWFYVVLFGFLIGIEIFNILLIKFFC